MSISVFDLDHTLLKVNSSFEFSKYLYAKKAISLFKMLFLILCYIGFSTRLISISRLHAFAFDALFKGRSKKSVDETVASFLDEKLDSLYFFPAIEQLKSARIAGHYVAIFSSSPDVLVYPIANRLEVDCVEATQYNVDTEGRFSGIKRIVLGKEKAKHLVELSTKLRIEKKYRYAYSDSDDDLPLLEEAGHPVAVSPNARLRRIANRKGWTIL